MATQQQVIAEITQEVIARLRTQLLQPSPSPRMAQQAWGYGIFPTVDQAVDAAYEAQKRVAELSVADRGRAIAIIRRMCCERAEELARTELLETKVGRLDHKIDKLRNIQYVLGVEAMRIDAR